MMWNYMWKISCFVTFLQFSSLCKADANSQNVLVESTSPRTENFVNKNESSSGNSFIDSGKLSGTSNHPVQIPNLTEDSEDSIGFAAEWEYIGPEIQDDSISNRSPSLNETTKQQQNIQYPSRRVGPGVWLDSNGNWWLFGGQGPSASIKSEDQSKKTHFLSDLWVYSSNESLPVSSASSSLPSSSFPSKYSWRLVFRPETNSEAPYSSFPENLDFPLLCGSENSKHIALYGSHKTNPRASTESHNSPFSEDNIVWLYDIPKAFSQEKVLRESSSSQTQGHGAERNKKSGCNWSSSSSFSPELCNGTSNVPREEEKQGLWTSYVCCDACLPDGNTTFEFCPQFSQDPISWCSQDSLMMLQLVITPPGDESKGSKEKSEASSLYSTSTTTFTSASFDKGKGSLRSNDNENIDGEKREKYIQDMTATTTQKIASLHDATGAISSDLKEHEIMRKNKSIQSRMNLPTRNSGRGASENNTNNAGEYSLSPGSPNSASSGKGNVDFLIENEETQKAVGQGRRKRPESEQTESGENQDSMRKSEKMKRNGRDVIKDVAKKNKNIIFSSNGKKSSESDGGRRNYPKTGNGGNSLNWWKFDLASTEWIKMPEVNIEGELTDQVRNGDCRVVASASSQLVYILCPTNGNLLDRVVILFDPKKASIRLLGTIHLNNAFSDKKVWQLGRSVLHALHCDNQTIIFLAYHKLLDLWIHDHSSNRLYPVENLWKGSSLHTFQQLTSFYKLSISLPIPWKNVEEPKETHTTHSFFMANPRLKLANYDDTFPQAHFHITIVPDRDVFLPPRDATYLISSTEFQSDDKFPMLNSSEKDKQSFEESNTASSLFKQDLSKQTKQNSPSSGISKPEQVRKPEFFPKPGTFTGENEPSLSQQTLPQMKSNKPPYEAPNPVKEKSLSNLQSDEKLQHEESPVHEVSAPLSKHNKTKLSNSSSRSNSGSDGGNGSTQQTKNWNPAASSSVAAVEFKSNNDNKGNAQDFIASPPANVFNPVLSEGSPSLSAIEKTNKMEEHRRNKYRTDIRSPKRVLLSKQESLRPGLSRNVGFGTTLISQKRILGIRKASVHSSTSTHGTTVIPLLAEAKMYEENGNDGEIEMENTKKSGIGADVKETSTPSKAPSPVRFRTEGKVPNETIVMTIRRDTTTSITSLVGNMTSDHVQIPNTGPTLSSKTETNFTTNSSNGQLRNVQENPITLRIAIVSKNIHEKNVTTDSVRSLESTTKNTHFNGESVAKSQDGSELTTSEAPLLEKTPLSSEAVKAMRKIIVSSSNENNNKRNIIPTPTTKSLPKEQSELENFHLLRKQKQKLLKQQQKQKLVFPAGRKAPVLAPKLAMTGKPDYQNLMNADSESSGIMIKKQNSGNILDSSRTNKGTKTNFSRDGLTVLKMRTNERDESSTNNLMNVDSIKNMETDISGDATSERPSATESTAAVAASPAGLFASVLVVDELNSSHNKTSSPVSTADDGDHDALVSDVNLNQPLQKERFGNGRESLNNGTVQKPSTNNAQEIDQLHPPASTVDLAQSTFSTWTQPNNLSKILRENSSTTRPTTNNTTVYGTTEGKGLSPGSSTDYFETPEKRATQSLREGDDDASSSTAAVNDHDHQNHDEHRESSTLAMHSPSGTEVGESFRKNKEAMKIQTDQSHPSHYMKSVESDIQSKEARVQNNRYSNVHDSSSRSTKFTNQLSSHSSQSILEEESLSKDENSQQDVTSSSFSSSTVNNNSNDNKNSHDDGEGAAEGEIDSPLSPMTYGSSEIVVEPRDDIMPYGEDESLNGDTDYSPTIFFAITLSFFASIGVVLFVRRCVKCPPRTDRQESVLIKEPPPIRYSVIPDDLSFHTPIV